MRALPLLLTAAAACVAPPSDGDAARVPEASPTGAPTSVDTLPVTSESDPAGRARQASTVLDRYDFGRRSARFDLPGRLDEISGLAFSPDGRLFAHDDERGRVHEIDPATGDVGKRWDLGEELARDDFEGIAIAGERFFLVSSRGLLYEFREGADEANVAYRVTDTGVGAGCEVEGLEYDAREDALLLACKVTTPERGVMVVHRLPLDPTRERLAPLLIARSQLGPLGLPEGFAPSGVAVDPWGTLLLVSGRDEALLEVDRTGRVLAGLELSADRHPQTEGVTFGPDGTLYLSDERNGGDARLTVYRPLSPEHGGVP